MPLHVADIPISLENVPEKFLIFYSSVIDGQPWCPDCVAVNDLLQQTFGSAKSPSALMVYVGNKPQWKSPINVFRNKPWEIQSIPTIVKLRDNKEDARLVGNEISAGLAAFV